MPPWPVKTPRPLETHRRGRRAGGRGNGMPAASRITPLQARATPHDRAPGLSVARIWRDSLAGPPASREGCPRTSEQRLYRSRRAFTASTLRTSFLNPKDAPAQLCRLGGHGRSELFLPWGVLVG